MPGGSSRVAVIDIGTNSTRLLVADVADGRVEEVERRTEVTRLGRGVDLSGSLSSEAIEAVCSVIAAYVHLYERLDVDRVAAIATSAVRDAANGEAFIAELRERFALTARPIGGDQEAMLTYLGATSPQPPAGSVLVIDIGGGSTELIVGSGGSVAFRTSLQLGVVRQTERHLIGDPPAPSELEELADEVLARLRQAIEDAPSVDSAIAVAGTPTSLAAIDLRLDPYDPGRVEGHRLTLGSIQRMLSRLASLALEQRQQVRGLHPDRAQAIVAGTVILIEVMRAFELDEVTVSEHDILHGMAIEAARLGTPNSG